MMEAQELEETFRIHKLRELLKYTIEYAFI